MKFSASGDIVISIIYRLHWFPCRVRFPNQANDSFLSCAWLSFWKLSLRANNRRTIVVVDCSPFSWFEIMGKVVAYMLMLQMTLWWSLWKCFLLTLEAHWDHLVQSQVHPRKDFHKSKNRKRKNDTGKKDKVLHHIMHIPSFSHPLSSFSIESILGSRAKSTATQAVVMEIRQQKRSRVENLGPWQWLEKKVIRTTPELFHVFHVSAFIDRISYEQLSCSFAFTSLINWKHIIRSLEVFGGSERRAMSPHVQNDWAIAN